MPWDGLRVVVLRIKDRRDGSYIGGYIFPTVISSCLTMRLSVINDCDDSTSKLAITIHYVYMAVWCL